MRGAQAVLGTWKGRKAAARLLDGRLDDLLIDARDDVPGPGAIFRAVCDRPARGQGGVFVRLPGGTGYLRGAKGLAAGAPVTVQVAGHAEPGKAVPVTDRLLFKSRHCIVTPGAPGVNVARRVRDDDARDRLLTLAHDTLPGDRGTSGAILRSVAEDADPEAVAVDLAALWDLAARVTADAGREPELLLAAPSAHDLAWREWSDVHDVAEGWEAHGIPDLVDALSSPEIRLGAATLFIEPTRAMVAVDVNTPEGGAGGLRANLAAARELLRQLRLRGLGGQIVVDLAPVPKRDRPAIEGALKSAARACPVETSFVGWTPLGHAELTRKRERRPLEVLL